MKRNGFEFAADACGSNLTMLLTNLFPHVGIL
jgi:hypothetical protein